MEINYKNILSEKKLNTKNYILWFHLYEILKKGKTIVTVNQQLPSSQELGEWSDKEAQGNFLG